MAIVLDQSYTGGASTKTHAGTNTSSYYGQTFTAGESGVLSKVSLEMYTTSGAGSWNFEIWSTSGDVPLAKISDTTNILRSDLPTGGFAYFDVPITGDVAQVAGTTYAIVIYPPVTSAGLSFHYATPSGYAGGRFCLSGSSGSSWTGYDQDINFKTYVDQAVVVSDDFPLDASLCKALSIDATLQRLVEDSFTLDATLQGTLGDTFTVDSFLKYPEDLSRHKVTMAFVVATPTVGTAVDGFRVVSRDARIARIYAILGTTGTVQDTVVDVSIDGTTVFTTQSFRLTIPHSSGSNQVCERIPEVLNIAAGQIITVDVDQVATDAANLAIVVELNVPTSYTHRLKDLVLLDTGITVNSRNTYSGFLTSQFQMQVVFDEPMDISVEPTITWNSTTMPGTPSIPSGGSWTSTYEQNDTYTTPTIDVSLSSQYLGEASVVVSDALNVFGDTIETFTFLLSLSGDSLVHWESEFTSELVNTLLVGSSTVAEFRYSFNEIDWSSWITYVAEVDIDISAAGIGGSATEGLKTLFVDLKDRSGNVVRKSAAIRYKLSIGQITDFILRPTLKPNYYHLSWNLPADAAQSPVQNFIVRLDGVQVAKIESIYPLNIDASLSSISVDDSDEEVTYSMSSGSSWGPNGQEFTLSAASVVAPYPLAEDRYDCVGINAAGEYQVVSGSEGLITRTPTVWEGEFLKKGLATANLPHLPGLPTGFLPLAYVWVRAEYWVQWSSFTEKVEKYLARVDDTSVYEMPTNRVACVTEIIPSAEQQVLTVVTVSTTGLTSTYTYNLSQTTLSPVEVLEMQAWSETNGGGSQVQSGSLVLPTSLVNNYVYLTFVKEEE